MSLIQPAGTHHVLTHAHLVCGLGGGGRGFNRATSRVGSLTASFRCLGGIDSDPAALRDFERLAGVPGTLLDLFDREQYRAFHGKEPPADWREATPDDIRRAFGFERPDVIFTSSPCKGFSGLLSESKSKSDKYQALNKLTLRGVWLALEAYKDQGGIDLLLFENVPRIATRGRALLDQITALLRAYGYAAAETSHDCGELGGLAQSRKRFLLVARNQARVRPFLYEPPKRSLRGVGEVLGKLPVPTSGRGGAMHRVPNLQWQTWVRLAFIEAGSDWRSLQKLRVADGQLADFRLLPEATWQNGALGVRAWSEPSGTITGNARANTGAFNVADPRRPDGAGEYGQYGMKGWHETSQAVTGKAAAGSGHCSVADPRHLGPAKHNNCFRIVPWGAHAPAVTGGTGPTAGGIAVADPRAQTDMFHTVSRTVPWSEPSHAITGQHAPTNGAIAVADPRTDERRSGALDVTSWDASSGTIAGESLPGNGAFAVADPRPDNDRRFTNIYRVTPWEEATQTVIGRTQPSDGALSVADPRPNLDRGKGDDYYGAGHFGVVPWTGTSKAVAGAAGHDNGHWSVADPRPPLPADRLVAIIRSTDGTWHRPMTTLELAALQSLFDPEDDIELDGASEAGWRERIGNAVPSDAAQAVAETMGRTLLLARSGEGFMLSALPIWVKPLAIALSVRQAGDR